MALDLQYTLINDTPADAGPPEANFSRIEQYINTEVIDRAGVTAMTGQLKLIGDPVEALDAAPKQYVDTFIPIGSILMFGGDNAPPGGKWAVCNGAELEIATYPALYAIYGTKYGGSAGHFNLPNLASRFPLGVGPSDVIGTPGGSRDAAIVNHAHPIDHTHAAFTTGNDAPDHNHVGADHTHGDDHMHTGTTVGASARHTHGAGQFNNFAVSTLSGNQSGTTGGGFQLNVVANTDVDTPDHNHPFSTNYKSQQGFGTNTTGADRVLTSAGASARHAHSAAVPAYAGASGTPTGGVAATNANLPPYLVINFIVRIA